MDPVRIIEALLLSAGEPLSIERLKKLADIEEGAEVRSLIEILRMDYEEEQRSFTIEEVGGGFRMYTRPEYSPWVARLRRQEKEFRLSPAALETLAIVAYRQPVLRADVEKIHSGVDVGGAMKTLIDRGMVKVVGRAEEPGSPLLYGTTKRFLESFGLRNLGELPKGNELQR